MSNLSVIFGKGRAHLELRKVVRSENQLDDKGNEKRTKRRRWKEERRMVEQRDRC